MISNITLGNGLEHWLKTANPDYPIKEWRRARNSWMREQGIGGVMMGEKKSKSIPEWWGDGTMFWFLTEDQEKSFTDAFSSN